MTRTPCNFPFLPSKTENFNKSFFCIKINANNFLPRKVTADELASVTEYLREGETVTDDANDGKVMPDYWLTVFKNGSMVMKDQDEPILKFLKKIDIRVEEHAKEPKQTKVATLKCFFDENEHFENTELSVVIEYEWLSVPKKSTGTVINWKPGKTITTKPIEKKKGKNQRKKEKKGGNTEKVAQKLSFFDIFRDFKVEKSTAVEDPMNPQPSLELVDEMVMGITDIAGEDSLYYYLDCVHMDDFEDLEAIDEAIFEENEEDEEETPKPVKGVPRKASHKSGKSGKSGKDGKDGKKSKKASRKNTADEVPIPEEPNKEECKQN